MPDQVPCEVTPHVLQALACAPDEPGAVTWIYPFDEYHDWTFASQSRANEVFFGDWFIRAAVNEGFPLNTVISTSNYLTARKKQPGLFRNAILTCPAPDAGTDLAKALIEHVDAGGNVLLYGPLRHTDVAIRTRLGVGITDGISGELSFETKLTPDTLAQGEYPRRIRLPELLSGGGAEETAPEDQAAVCAWVGTDGERRAFSALARTSSGGSLGWVRGAFCETIGGGQLPIADNPQEWFHASRLMRWILQEMGVVLRFIKADVATQDPVILASRSRNAWFFSGFSRSTTVRLQWRMPAGVPVPVGCDVALKDGFGEISLPRAWQRECRVFVTQKASGEVACRELHSGEIGVTRRIRVLGLIDADVTFYADSEAAATPRFQKNDGYLGTGANIENRQIEKGVFIATGVTGDLIISW
jgi:hypothetical protein